VSVTVVPGERSPSALEVIKDNLEAFAVAIVMALVIKHFCVEAFRIPTGSMEPTLLGEAEGRREGDRILVDKLAYLFHGPARWDVIVFRYPLDQSRNFVKRVAGLPGETIRIKDGDVWTQEVPGAPFRIATKPPRAREELYFKVYPPLPPPTPAAGEPPLEGPPTTKWWRGEGEPNAWRVESLARFEYVGGAEAALRYVPPIGAMSSYERPGSAGESVRDVRVSGRVVPGVESRLRVGWRADAEVLVELRLGHVRGGPDGSTLAVMRSGRELVRRPLDVVLEPGRRVDFVLEAVDGEARAWIDGEEVAVLSQGRTIEETWSADQHLALAASGGALRVEGFRIDRDLAYTNREMSFPELQEGLQIPGDAYFMLGDNTASSSDSRRWERECQRLQDGRRICWDKNPGNSPGEGPQFKSDGVKSSVTDVDGIRRHWLNADEDGSTTSERVPFVRRHQVVGRAFFIFWPLFPDFPHRMRLIH
jgi:signal peptidase I